jgi:uncharacterized protein YcfL
MNTRHLLFAAAALGLAACGPEPIPVPRDARLIVTPEANVVVVSEPAVSTANDGRMRVLVEVTNPLAGDVPLRVQTDWLAASGRPIQSMQSRAVTVLVPRYGRSTIIADAPNIQARDFRMQIDIATN